MDAGSDGAAWIFVLGMGVIAAPWTWISGFIVARTPPTRRRFWVEAAIGAVLNVAVLLPMGGVTTGLLALMIYAAAAGIGIVLFGIFQSTRHVSREGAASSHPVRIIEKRDASD